jgi:hypothetical protein
VFLFDKIFLSPWWSLAHKRTQNKLPLLLVLLVHQHLLLQELRRKIRTEREKKIYKIKRGNHKSETPSSDETHIPDFNF